MNKTASLKDSNGSASNYGAVENQSDKKYLNFFE